jgi:signal transduction histidine kinase
VDDVLDVSRINSDKLELRRVDVCMREVIEQAIATSRPLIDRNVHTLVVNVPDEPLTVDGDHVRLVQVVANLLNNAACYTPPGGRVHLSCSCAGDQIELRVQDNGHGIAKEALSQLFEPFVQEGREQTDGLGLGLAIVHRLVLLHGGTVTAHSAGPGLGSEFVVRLPLASSQ